MATRPQPNKMTTFYINTGVTPGVPKNEKHRLNALPVQLGPGQVWRNGTKQIPFDCDDVPANAVFAFLSNDSNIEGEYLVRSIHNSTLLSKYAYFKLVKSPTMNTDHNQKAIELISKSTSVKVSFNVPVRDDCSNVHKILIHECNAEVIRELVGAGFSLYMTPKGLSIDHF